MSRIGSRINHTILLPQQIEMDSDKLSFLDENQSVASLVTQLHDYFKNSHSHCKVKRSQLLSKLDNVSGEQEQAVLGELHRVDEELTHFGVLNDALSIADRVLHSKVVMDALGIESEVYQIHHETDSERAAEWKMAEYRLTQQKNSEP